MFGIEKSVGRETSLRLILFSLIFLGLGHAVLTQVGQHEQASFQSTTQAIAQHHGVLLSTFYSSNVKAFQPAIDQLVTKTPSLVSLQVIDDTQTVVIDTASGEKLKPANAELKALLGSSKSTTLQYHPDRCLDEGVMIKKRSLSATFLQTMGKGVSRVYGPSASCPTGQTVGLEYLLPRQGEKNLTLRYLFTYQDIFSNLGLLATLWLVGFLLILLWFIFVRTHIVTPLQMLKAGAFAMAGGNLKHRVKTKLKNEMGVIANFMNEVARNLEKVIQDLNEKERISSELDIASRIQRNLIPQIVPELPGLELAGNTRSSTEVGGDHFDFIQINPDSALIYIGDVTGHGVPACLIMIMVDVLINTYATQFTNTRELIINVNRQLYPRIDSTLFMTMIMFNWNIPAQRLTYTSCGHEHIIHYHAKTQKCSVTRSGGLALGMVPDISKLAVEKEIPLEEGDAIVLYSDGITEAKNLTGEMFGLKRVVEAVELYGYKNANGIFDKVTRELSGYIGTAQQEDDITLIVMKYKAADQEEIQRLTKKAKISLSTPTHRDRVKWDWSKGKK